MTDLSVFLICITVLFLVTMIALVVASYIEAKYPKKECECGDDCPCNGGEWTYKTTTVKIQPTSDVQEASSGAKSPNTV